MENGEREALLVEVLPVLRGAVSLDGPRVLQVDTSPPAVEFVCGSESGELSQIGAACPDHLVHTRRTPVWVEFDAASEDAAALRARVVERVREWQERERAYFDRYSDGDTLSDFVMQLFGTIAGAESTLLSFTETGAVSVAMTEAPHGTAPALEGKNVANPTAMILAGASLLAYMPGENAHRASRAVYEATLEAISSGVRTADLGGHSGTTDFTDEVVKRVQTKLDVWSSLADIQA